jgi:hypothetical protein
MKVDIAHQPQNSISKILTIINLWAAGGLGIRFLSPDRASEFPLAVSQKILYEEGYHAHKSFSGALSPILFWGLVFGSRLVPGLTGKKEL